MELYSARKVIEEVVRNYQVDTEILGDCTVVADEAFSSVIDNIVSNAVTHGQANHVSIQIQSEEGEGGHCWIRIADDGTGIPVEKKEEVFEEGFSGNGGRV